MGCCNSVGTRTRRWISGYGGYGRWPKRFASSSSFTARRRTMTSSAAAVVSTADFVLYIYHRWRDWLAVLDIRDRRFATTAQRLHTLNRTPTLSHSHTQAHRHTDALTHTHKHALAYTREGGVKKKAKKETFWVFWFVSTRLLALPFCFQIVPRRVVTHTHRHTIGKKNWLPFPLSPFRLVMMQRHSQLDTDKSE